MTTGKAGEPDRRTDPRLDDVLVELRGREPIFHRLELGTTREDFEAQTAPDFWEVGGSGRRYSREFVWATLEERYADPATRSATPGRPASSSAARSRPTPTSSPTPGTGPEADPQAHGLAAVRWRVAIRTTRERWSPAASNSRPDAAASGWSRGRRAPDPRGVAPPRRRRVPGLDEECPGSSVEHDNALRPKGIPMKRLIFVATAVALLLCLGAPAVLAADPLPRTGSVLVSVNHPVDIPAGDHLDTLVVVGGTPGSAATCARSSSSGGPRRHWRNGPDPHGRERQRRPAGRNDRDR